MVKRIFCTTAAFVSFIIFGKTLSAQIVGANCYLKGNYVEVGINQCGAFGSNEAPPVDYHPTEIGLGFVADGDKDGWDEGDPDYCGDYFVPGSPVEGWSLQIGDASGSYDVYYNTDQFCSPDDIPGEVTEYSYSGGIYSGTWEGDVDEYDLHISQVTTLPEDKVYFVTRILLCNEGTEDINDVYYMRNVDPDNDQPWSGDFTTDNVIVYNPPTDEQALVTSEGLTYGCYLGLGARDPNSRVTYGNFATTAGIPQNVYEGTAGYSLDGDEVGDIANSIAFYVPTIPVGECKCVAFAYILDADDLEEALDATVSYNLTANGEAIPSSGLYYICNPGDEVNLEVLGAEDYFWTWSPSGIFDIDTGVSVVATGITDEVEITATGVGGFCGDATVSLTIKIDNEELADAGDDEPICIGSSTTLNGNGGTYDSLYTWSPTTGLSDPNISNPIASPTETTTYTLTTIDDFGCPETDEITITVNPLPEVDAGADGKFCIDGEYQLEASGAESYVWSPEEGLNNPNIYNPITTVDEATVYTVTGTDENGCVNTDEVSVTVDLLPEVIASADPYSIDTYLGETTQLSVETGGVSFLWTPSEGLSSTTIENPIANPSDTTIYIVTVTDENGCVNTDTVKVNAMGEVTVDIPNAFSPNGDGVNDYFYPIFQGSGKIINYMIYNRWGELVYEGSHGDSGWDGTFKGKPSDIGSYVIIVNASTSLDESKFYTQNFVLVK